MSLADRRGLRLFTLCALYIAQGIPWGFMATTLPAYLTDRGLDFAFVSATLSFTTLPYTFKWIWGPVIDTVQIPRFGRRRPWIVFAQAMMAVTVIVLVTFDLTSQVKLLAWMILIHTVFNSLQDVSVDALAVDLLGDDERGSANGMMYGSKYVGGFIGGAVMANLVAWTNLDTALIVQTSILVAIMLVPLLVRERDTPPPPREHARQLARDLGQAFSLRSTLVAALLMLGSNLAIGTVVATGFGLFVGELGWKPDDYTNITGGWGLLVGGACAGLAGFAADKVGRRRLAAIASFGLALGWFAFALCRPYWHDHALVYVFGLWEACWTSIVSVALIALSMDLSWPRVGGSQFAAYMALSNFSTTIGYLIAPKVNSWWEFHGVYAFAGIAQLVIALLLIPIDPKEARTKLPLPEGTSPNRVALAGFLVLVAFLVAMTVKKTLETIG